MRTPRGRPGIVDTAQTVFSQHAAEIALILVIALLLLYLLLGAQFESFVQPLIILVAVPLAATGVLGALLFTGQSLNLNSGLGVLVLFGTVVKTSIILFANYQPEDRSGRPVVLRNLSREPPRDFGRFSSAPWQRSSGCCPSRST